MQRVIISEPWNFKSSAGENELLGNTGEYNIYILGNDAFDIDSKNLKLSMIGRFE